MPPTAPTPPTPSGWANLLVADCANCAGLCCVALAFARSADFAFDKGAGDPCSNLADDFRCRIHPDLRQQGFKGCTVFDCFGAGQKVTQGTFGGQSWRAAPDTGPLMFAVFPIVRQLHELLWYLNEAIEMPKARPMHAELRAILVETERLAGGPAEAIGAMDVGAHRDRVTAILSRASDVVRAGIQGSVSTRRSRRLGPGADLIGAKLAGSDLRGANLRGAYLIGADLRAADLRWTDLTGADLRDADLRGTDLSESLFLHHVQLSSAVGNADTVLPIRLARPPHWAS
jgi:hypothetical protein